MPSTHDALLARGIDTATVSRLIDSDYTIKRLKSASDDELSDLGLSVNQIETIRSGSRPPIPADTLFRLLFDCRRTCCLCRDTSRSIIVHHIEPWATSRSHAEENLVVLCLEHHDLAHTKKELSLGLKPAELRAAKKQWKMKAGLMDAAAVLGVAACDQGRWDYINYPRFFELVLMHQPAFEDIHVFSHLKMMGLLDNFGTLADEASWNFEVPKLRRFRTDFDGSYFWNFYMKELIHRVFSNIPLVDLTNRLYPKAIQQMLTPGQFFSCQLGFRYRDIKVSSNSGSQMREAYYKKGDLHIHFVFDTWNCTSSSGLYDALSGHQIGTPICLLKSMKHDGNRIVLESSCYAIGTWFDDLRVDRAK